MFQLANGQISRVHEINKIMFLKYDGSGGQNINSRDLKFGIKNPPLKLGPKVKLSVIYVFWFACAVRRVYFYKTENDLLLHFLSL